MTATSASRYQERMDALRAYVAVMETDTTTPTVETEAQAATRQAAFDKYAAIRDKDGPVTEVRDDLEAGS